MTRPTENFLWNVHRNTLNLLANRCLEPLAIQFSGGRTSAYMLRRLLDLYGGAFPDTVRVTFYNTGLEHPETLNFVHRVETEWNVPITWLEYDPHAAHKVRLVNHNSASRDGRPFWDLFTVPVERRRDGTRGLRPLPGPGMRICTAQLKIELGYRYLTKVIGWPAKWGYYEAIASISSEHRGH
jgi:3'-phosphoadenosine 5'-phosphosulfate sulfotransferase (PAPS reductase)/FAD synthetase